MNSGSQAFSFWPMAISTLQTLSGYNHPFFVGSPTLDATAHIGETISTDRLLENPCFPSSSNESISISCAFRLWGCGIPTYLETRPCCSCFPLHTEPFLSPKPRARNNLLNQWNLGTRISVAMLSKTDRVTWSNPWHYGEICVQNHLFLNTSRLWLKFTHGLTTIALFSLGKQTTSSANWVAKELQQKGKTSSSIRPFGHPKSVQGKLERFIKLSKMHPSTMGFGGFFIEEKRTLHRTFPKGSCTEKEKRTFATWPHERRWTLFSNCVEKLATRSVNSSRSFGPNAFAVWVFTEKRIPKGPSTSWEGV